MATNDNAKEIARAFELIFEACGNIKDHDACDDCPLHYLCLEDPEVSVIDLGDLISATSWDEFLTCSERAEYSKAKCAAQYADFKRKYDLEERMIDDEYGG